MFCLVVGTMVYCGADARETNGDAVTSVYVAYVDPIECVAPIGRAKPNVAVSAACFPTVTTEPADGPLLTTVHETIAADGNVYIALAATVTETVVRVETNVSVNVVAVALVAVTVASITLSAAKFEPSVAVIAGTVASITRALVKDPDANAPRAELIAVTELLNVNCFAVAYDATSAYVSPPEIVDMVTVSGTAYTVWPIVATTFVAPDGAVTVTRNSRLPVVEPSVIDVTSTVCVAPVYVYDATPPTTSALPT
jgi:hypothetical protein